MASDLEMTFRDEVTDCDEKSRINMSLLRTVYSRLLTATPPL